MNPRRLTSLGWVLGALLGAATAAAVWGSAQPEPTAVHVVERPAHSRTVITEDDPRFDCASMGNGKCGPGPMGTRR